MKKMIAGLGLALVLMALDGGEVAAQGFSMGANEEVELTATVVDMSCKIVFNLSGEDHRMCSQMCADFGIPLGLLTDDGEFLLPVSSTMPGKGSNELLKPHAEHRVRIKGRVFERAGSRAIIIDDLQMEGS
ncbi:MAG: hypothetical protein BMS9Abin29_2470 [Gemmatimonadota bacterium]|nr:MAG: hypothetical protein BMS9Abin29_2470 [Gemmatimonadota bacterium]